MERNDANNGVVCQSCYSQRQFYAAELTRLAREREVLQQQKQQCIAAHNRAGGN